MSSQDLFTNLLHAYHEYMEADAVANEAKVDEEGKMPAGLIEDRDEAQTNLKDAFDAYIFDLLKTKGKV